MDDLKGKLAIVDQLDEKDVWNRVYHALGCMIIFGFAPDESIYGLIREKPVRSNKEQLLQCINEIDTNMWSAEECKNYWMVEGNKVLSGEANGYPMLVIVTRWIIAFTRTCTSFENKAGNKAGNFLNNDPLHQLGIKLTTQLMSKCR
jgi:hypothetical protein